MILLIAIGLAIFVVPDPWKVPVVVAGGAIEAAETAIEVWWSRRQRPTVGPEAIIGAVGTVVRDCRPDGQVRVRGETWKARCDAGADADARVRVVAREGLTLLVERVA